MEEAESETAAKESANTETRPRRGSKESADADSAAPTRARRSSRDFGPQLDPWEETFAGPSVPTNVARIRRNSRDLSAKVMQLQYAKFAQSQEDEAALQPAEGAPKAPASLTDMMANMTAVDRQPSVAQTDDQLPQGVKPFDPFGGDKIHLAAKAALAAKKQGEAKTAVAVGMKGLGGGVGKGNLRLMAAARLVQRNRALRDADLMLHRGFIKQVGRTHLAYAAALSTDARLWRDWEESITEQIMGILACLSRHRAMMTTIIGDVSAPNPIRGTSDVTDNADGDVAADGRTGNVQEASLGASSPATAMTTAERMDEQLERMTHTLDVVDKACEQASFEASEEQWRRVQDKAALEEAERLALALESWMRERRSELRQYDHLEQAGKFNPEMAAHAISGVSLKNNVAKGDKASERRQTRLEASAAVAAPVGAAAQRMAQR